MGVSGGKGTVKERRDSVAIPPSNYSQCILDSWFVISLSPVSAKNAKLFKPLLGGGEWE